MKSEFNRRWMIAGMIWLTVLGMTFWNGSKIDAVAKARENSERLRKEYLFQHRNAERLLKIQNQYATYFRPVASVKLGFESVRSPLYALAAHLGLKNVRIENQMEQATAEQMPFSVRLIGDYEKSMRFVSALLTQPYLSVKNSRFTVQNERGEAEIEMELYFQFKIQPQNEMGRSSLQASAYSTTQGVQPE
jgi:Tfp pilus assembly protein PilO